MPYFEFVLLTRMEQMTQDLVHTKHSVAPRIIKFATSNHRCF